MCRPQALHRPPVGTVTFSRYSTLWWLIYRMGVPVGLPNGCTVVLSHGLVSVLRDVSRVLACWVHGAQCICVCRKLTDQ